MEIYVAKSYQGLPIVEEPYEKNKKMYCKVRLKSGKVKEIRVYNPAEYEKMYPASTTKIMTAILTIENCKLTDTAIASHNAVFSFLSGLFFSSFFR